MCGQPSSTTTSVDDDPAAMSAWSARSRDAVTVINKRPFESLNCVSTSSAVDKTFTGVADAPARKMPWNAIAIAERFGEQPAVVDFVARLRVWQQVPARISSGDIIERVVEQRHVWDVECAKGTAKAVRLQARRNRLDESHGCVTTNTEEDFPRPCQ